MQTCSLSVCQQQKIVLFIWKSSRICCRRLSPFLTCKLCLNFNDLSFLSWLLCLSLITSFYITVVTIIISHLLFFRFLSIFIVTCRVRHWWVLYDYLIFSVKEWEKVNFGPVNQHYMSDIAVLDLFMGS